MKGRGQGKQRLAGEAEPPGPGRREELCNARGAEQPVVELHHAFAAEIPAALRAAGHGFATGMAETTLRGKVLDPSALPRSAWSGAGTGWLRVRARSSRRNCSRSASPAIPS